MKVGIVGSGLVGATAAYALVMKGIAREIVLVDKDRDRAQSEAEDILHAVPYAHPLEVSAGGYESLSGCRLVIVAAGVGQKPGESRVALLARNAAVFLEVIPAILDRAEDAILVIATNPVDVMTHLAAQYGHKLGCPSGRVIGAGTMLDTARFRTLLGRHLGVEALHVHGYVVGEHGDSEVLTWSSARIGGLPLDTFAELQGLRIDGSIKEGIEHQVRQAAYDIIRGKGATYYGIGAALARLAEVILQDQRSILTVCTPAAEVAGVMDVTISLPRLVGGRGVLATLPLHLEEGERSALRASAETVKKAIEKLDGIGST